MKHFNDALTQGTNEGSVCEDCYRKLNEGVKDSKRANESPSITPRRRKCAKFTPSTATGVSGRRRVTYRLKTRAWQYSIANIVSRLRRSQYERAIRLILTCGPAARRAFDRVVSQLVAEQVRNCVKQTGTGRAFQGAKTLHGFNWKEHKEQLDMFLPTLMSAVTGAMPKKFFANHQLL